MKKFSWRFTIVFLLLPGLHNPAHAQSPGPVIPGYGKVWQIPGADIPQNTDMEFHAVFDVSDNSVGEQGVNRQLETAARFLNMHVQGGIPAEKLRVALVVHGKATEDLLKPGSYKERQAGVENKNLVLVDELLQAGVRIVVCGQSASAMKIERDETIEGVEWALSAMTALIYFQNEGYRLIKF